MKLSSAIRWSGLASVLGGVLWWVLILLKLSDEFTEFIRPYDNYLTPLPLVLFLVGLAGLFAVLKTGSKSPEGTGFVLVMRAAGLTLAFGGLAVAIVGSIFLRSASYDVAQQTIGWYAIYLGGTGVSSIGMTLLGITVLRTKALPRWNGSPLAIGLLGILWMPCHIVATLWISTAFFEGLTQVVSAVFGAGWVALGYVLWTAPFVWLEQRMERLSDWMSRLAFFDILETIGKLTVLVVLIAYIFGADDRERQRHYNAWQVVTGAEGQDSTAGRKEALEELNGDGQSLVGLVAEDADLSGIDLEGAVLDSAKLRETDLSGANFQDATLWRADLEEAYLADAQLNNAVLEEADLRKANLTGAELRNAELVYAKLDGSRLDRARLGGAELGNASLRNANLSGVQLQGATLTEANLFQVGLDNANLAESNLQGANLTNANLSGAELQGAVLKKAFLWETALTGAKLQGADFQGADLTGADIRNTDLRDVKNLEQEQLNVAQGDDTTLLPEREDLAQPSSWQELSNTMPAEGSIPAERYVTEEFAVPFSFTVDDGWEVEYSEVDNAVRILHERGDWLSFLLVKEVINPNKSGLETTMPKPDDLIDWFRGHPYLNISEPAPVEVGGMSGVVFDTYISTPPDDYPTSSCNNPCVPLLPLNDGTNYFLYQDIPERIALVDFAGEPVIITFDPYGDTQRIKDVLGSVDWTAELEELSVGEHQTERFQVPFSYVVREDWQVTQELSDGFTLGNFAGSSSSTKALGIVNVSEVFDPDDPSAENTQPAPKETEDLLAWFQQHRYLDVGEPKQVDIGGMSGKQFDVSVSTVPLDYPYDICGEPCVPLFRHSDGGPFFLFAAYRNRVTVLNVEGEIVVVTIESPPEEFGQFLPEAQEVLDSVKWGG